MRVYIWGAGKYGKKVLQLINKESCEIRGFIDNDPKKSGKEFEGYQIVLFQKINLDFDFIIISIPVYEAVLYQLEKIEKIDMSKVIVFFDEAYSDNFIYSSILDQQKWKIIILEYKVQELEKLMKARFDNIGYEIIDKYNNNIYEYPLIGSTRDAIEKIIKEGCSLVRFGDGEFEIMAGKERAVFQNYNSELAKRLTEVIHSSNDKLLIAIANNYGALDKYIEDSANGIRLYMNEETRKFHMSVLDPNKVYYDAYMFKSYFPYKNRENTWKRVKLVKKIWEERDVIVIEGDKTRTGYKNDLFNNVKSLKRILAPTINAYDKYDDILNAALEVSKNCLILVVLGPTAKILVYDLMKKGYQAIDIGQIDMDYEWYLAGAEKRIPIPDRYVSQLPPAEIKDVYDKEYLDQIIVHI